MSILSDAVEVMHESTRELGGVEIKLRHGNSDVELTANRGQSTSEDNGDDGAIVTSRLQDWILDPSAMKIDGVEFKPGRGDKITVLETGKVFAIVPAAGEKYWRWSDQTEVAIRVHSVEEGISTE